MTQPPASEKPSDAVSSKEKHPATEQRWPTLLNSMTSAIAVSFRTNGSVTAANRGFWAALEMESSEFGSFSITPFLVQPKLGELVRTHTTHKSTQIYEGLIHLGDSNKANVHTLNGRITQVGEEWILIAEHDVRSLQQLAAQVLHLNEELTDMHRELKRSQEQLRALSVTDPLTGLANRRRLEERLELEIARVERTQKPLAVALVDIDHFKQINDRYGHPVGDSVLKEVSELLTENLRAPDLAARYGGEEFCLVFPDTALEEALGILERTRQLIAQREIPPMHHAVTASFGVACCSREQSPETLIEAADKALYRAKNDGRNRVCVESIAE